MKLMLTVCVGLTFLCFGISVPLRRIANNPRYFFAMKEISIVNFSDNIRSIPIDEHSFVTNHKTWEPYEYKSKEFKSANKKIFKEGDAEINRYDLFKLNQGDPGVFTFSVFYWGYPTGGMLNLSMNKIIEKENIKKLITTISYLQRKKVAEEFEEVLNQFKEVKGIGLSTYSKFLHFLNYKIAGYPCLILDSRLIKVFNKGLFKEFLPLKNVKYDSGEKHYVDFLKIMHETAVKMNTSAAKIEMFLFTNGLNIKPIKNKYPKQFSEGTII